MIRMEGRIPCFLVMRKVRNDQGLVGGQRLFLSLSLSLSLSISLREKREENEN